MWLKQLEGAFGAGGGASYRLQGGYDRLVRWLRGGLDPRTAVVRLATVVSAIDWRPGELTARAAPASGGPAESFHAGRAVITLPLGVLRAPPGSPGAVRFAPDLTDRAAVWERLEMGAAVKAVLRFREAFWEGVAPGLAFLHTPQGPFQIWWTPRPVRVPVLTAWAGGPAAAALAGLGKAALIGQALEGLRRALPIDGVPLLPEGSPIPGVLS